MPKRDVLSNAKSPLRLDAFGTFFLGRAKKRQEGGFGFESVRG